VRFRNDTGNVLTVAALSQLLGPNEVLDWPGWDPVKDGSIPGCTQLEPALPQKPAPQDPPGTGQPAASAAKDPAAPAAPPAAPAKPDEETK
jgi:hypothetical protein